MSQALLQVDGLSKRYRGNAGLFARGPQVVAVDDVSFEINVGESVALVGESGAGKSTVARLVTRLVAPDAGAIVFDGKDLLALSPRELRAERTSIQMIFQDARSSLDPRIVVWESVAEPLLVHTALSSTERKAEVVDLFRRVGLSERYMARLPRELSGGQLQRVGIARALATRPKLIVCDEPVAALDVLIRAQVINLLRDIQEELGVAYLFITHDLALLRAIADRALVMRNGGIVERALIDQLYTQPQHPYTQALLAAVPRIEPRRREPPSDDSVGF